jgi:hypothetical protein
MEGNMNGLPRWKENRIRQEVHLAHLKHPKTLFNGDGAHGAYPLGRNGTSVRFLEQRPNTGSDKRTLEPKERESTSLDDSTLALLAIAVAAWLWVYLCQFGIHR